MRRLALLLAGTMVLSTVAFAGPASAAKITSCKKDKKVNANIQKAFIPFFIGKTGAEKVATVQDGDKITSLVDQSTAAASAAGLTVPGEITLPVEITAKCVSKKSAEFSYDLALKQPEGSDSTPPATSSADLNFKGDAVLVGGKWLITRDTICDLSSKTPGVSTDFLTQCLSA